MWLGQIHYTITQLWIYLDESNYFYNLLNQRQNTAKLPEIALSEMETGDPVFIISSD